MRFGPVLKKNRNIFFRKRGRGGGSEAVQKFSGNSSIFEKTGFPYVHLRAKLGRLHWLQEKEISFRSTKLAEQECGVSMGRIECGEDEEDDVWPEFCVRQPASDIGCGCGGGRRWVYIFQCTYISKEGGVYILNIYFMRGSSIGLDPRSAVDEMTDIIVSPAFKEYDICWVF